jgi:transcription initiation factor TFIIA large subunit
LTQLQVATFPWDPKPEPQPTIANPPTVPSNAGNYQSMSTPPINQPQPGLGMPQISNGPRIKAEPGLESPLSGNQGQPPYQNQAPLPALTNATPAQQRAAQHLHQSYGPRAAASINAIQSGGGQQPQGQQNGQQPTMQQMQMMQQQRAAQMAQQQGQGMQQGQRPQMTQEQYRQMMAANTANRMAQQVQQNGQNSVQGAQTDGAADEEVDSLAVIKRFDSNDQEVAMGRIEIDNLIRSKIEAMGQSMEGGGLMLPLHQASTPKSRRQRKDKKGKGRQQVDGGDDDDKDGVKDEELDEDAINSDLDDPDEGLNDEEDEDEGMGHIMLCMYDKVQRVKNKWYVVLPSYPYLYPIFLEAVGKDYFQFRIDR